MIYMPYAMILLWYYFCYYFAIFITLLFSMLMPPCHTLFHAIFDDITRAMSLLPFAAAAAIFSVRPPSFHCHYKIYDDDAMLRVMRHILRWLRHYFSSFSFKPFSKMRAHMPLLLCARYFITLSSFHYDKDDIIIYDIFHIIFFFFLSFIIIIFR